MSDAAEKTPGGATRAFFGALAFILLMVGTEGVTGVASIPIIFAVFLLLLAVPCFCAAVFWERAKTWLSVEAQERISRFSQHPVVRFGMLFLVLQALILSKFVEQHRWPFSFPADPAIYAENEKFRRAVDDADRAFGRERELADKWRFAKRLRDARGLDAKEVCHYQLAVTPKAQSSTTFWHELLRYGGWIADRQGPTNSALIQPGITLRISDDEFDCATTLQRALTDIYANPPSKISPNQQTNCGKDCVLIEMDY
jgi:hypothetical protein